MARSGDYSARMAGFSARATEVVHAAAVALHAAVVQKYSTPGMGRVYGRHRASKPGDPPAPDTGVLRNSVQLSQTETGYRVATGEEYAPFLEFGTPRIAPRPAWRPAIDEVVAQFGRHLTTEPPRQGG